jgi:hypothetical protein
MKGLFLFPCENSGDPDAAWSRVPVLVFRLLVPLILFCILLFYWTGTSAGRSYEIKKKVGDYEVGVILDRNPPIIGDNPIEIEIKDGSGKSVTDAKVLVNYYMPPMPRMAPMNYTTEAKLKKDKYRATMNIIMAGPWYISVKINHRGKMTTAKFNIDAQ